LRGGGHLILNLLLYKGFGAKIDDCRWKFAQPALTKRGKEEDLLSLLDVVIGGTLLYDLPIYIHIDG
jgi:hypothetical protein